MAICARIAWPWDVAKIPMCALCKCSCTHLTHMVLQPSIHFGVSGSWGSGCALGAKTSSWVPRCELASRQEKRAQSRSQLSHLASRLAPGNAAFFCLRSEEPWGRSELRIFRALPERTKKVFFLTELQAPARALEHRHNKLCGGHSANLGSMSRQSSITASKTSCAGLLAKSASYAARPIPLLHLQYLAIATQWMPGGLRQARPQACEPAQSIYGRE